MERIGVYYAEKVLTLPPEKRVLKDLPTGARWENCELSQNFFETKLIAGKEIFDCESEAEAKYLKVFIELSWQRVYVPVDTDYLEEIVPRLVYLKKRLDEIIDNGLKRVFGRKIRRETKQLTYKKISAIPTEIQI